MIIVSLFNFNCLDTLPTTKEPLRNKKLASYNETVSKEVSRLAPPSASIQEIEDMWDATARVTKKQQEETQRIADRDSEILKGVWDYLKYDTAPGAIINSLNNSFHTRDPEFDPFNYDNFKTQSDWEHDQIGEAVNAEHYEAIKARLEDIRDYKENMQSMGTPLAITAGVFAGILNPFNYLLFFFMRSLTKRKTLSISVTSLWVIFMASWKVLQ